MGCTFLMGVNFHGVYICNGVYILHNLQIDLYDFRNLSYILDKNNISQIKEAEFNNHKITKIPPCTFNYTPINNECKTDPL